MGSFFQTPFIEEAVDKSVVILDRDLKVLSIDLTGDDKFRHWVGLETINPQYVKKILEKEDQYFYYHYGVNPISFLRASYYYFFSSRDKGGASTITMQLARLYYKLETKSLAGKLLQVFAASFIEYRMSKKQILEAYFNLIPMGRNIEGIETAALYLFHKNTMNLTPSELNFLSFLPQNPSLLTYLYNKDFQRFHSILKKTYEGIAYKDSVELIKSLRIAKSRPFHAPHFSEYIKTQTDKKIVKTTLSLDYHLKIDKILKNYIEKVKERGVKNATSLLIDSTNNSIVAYIGSADFHNNSIQGQVNGLMALRSPGSTLKPFIYGMAFDEGMLHGKSIVLDSPLPYRTPENYDRTYIGPITVEKALITSRNIPAVFINNELQAKNKGLFTLLNNLYPSLAKNKSYYGSSIALGALELSSLHLGELYSMLSNNGEYRKVNSIVHEEEDKSISFMSAEASIMVKDILKNHSRPEFGHSEPFTQQAGDVYWKTGTSFGFRDAWAAGIWNKYILVTWVGDFKGKSNPYLVGSISAAPLFFEIIDYLRHEAERDESIELQHSYHANLTEVDVCSVSGDLPNEYCQALVSTLFIKNKSPIHKCQIHRKVKLSKSSHLRICPEFRGESYEKVFEFFSNDKLSIYQKHGLNLKLPPGYDSQCQEKVISQNQGLEPVIISPKIGFTYISKDGEAIIPLHARADSDSQELSWYIKSELIRKSPVNKTATVVLNKGTHTLKVIDNFGRVAFREVIIK